ncbi:hypothetical protein, partial [Achromobacter anxifer]
MTTAAQVSKPHFDDCVFAALHHAVTLAKDLRIERVDVLKRRLREHGHAEGAVDAAIRLWAERVADHCP